MIIALTYVQTKITQKAKVRKEAPSLHSNVREHRTDSKQEKPQYELGST